MKPFPAGLNTQKFKKTRRLIMHLIYNNNLYNKKIFASSAE